MTVDWIRRRNGWRLAGLFLVSILAGVLAVSLLGGTGGDAGPDVVLITIAAANRDHFTCYGYHLNTTPHICSVAADGTRYTNAFTTSAEDPQTLTAIHTGKHAYDLGVLVNEMEDIPSDNFTTLAGELNASHERYLYKFGAAYGTGPFTAFNLLHKLEQPFDTVGLIGAEERPGVILDLARRMEQETVYARLHSMDIHSVVTGVTDNARTYEGRPYDGRLKYVDTYIGSFLGELRRRGLYDDTFIVIAGNYGSRIGADEGHSVLYPATVRVPLLIKPSRSMTPRTEDRLVSLRDLKPTILAAATGRDDVERTRNMLSADYAVDHVPMFIASDIIGDARKVWLGVADRDTLITLTANGTTTYLFNASMPEERVGRLLERLSHLRDHIVIRVREGIGVSAVVRSQLRQIEAIDLGTDADG